MKQDQALSKEKKKVTTANLGAKYTIGNVKLVTQKVDYQPACWIRCSADNYENTATTELVNFEGMMHGIDLLQ